MAGITGLMPEATADDVARAALTGRREVVLLDDPSVRAMTRLLVSRWRSPAPWVRAAVATLDRFAREVASGDLPGKSVQRCDRSPHPWRGTAPPADQQAGHGAH